MSIISLNTRTKKILQVVVEAYIENALPVSSQAIAQRLRSEISPATARNEMARLDAMGLVWQPHTSAGRIPTDKGYRYYIDSLLEIKELSPQDRQLINTQCRSWDEAFDQVLSGALRILSHFSGYTSLALASFGGEKLLIERVSCILEQPEFQNTRKLQAIFRTFEEKVPLVEILKEDLILEGVRVHIGRENPYVEIQECSLVVSSFKIDRNNRGALGIIGPRRMSYPRAISTVEYMAQILSQRSQ